MKAYIYIYIYATGRLPIWGHLVCIENSRKLYITKKSFKPLRVLFRTFVRFLDDVATINTKCPGFSPAEDVEVHDRFILLPYASSRRKSNVMGSLALALLGRTRVGTWKMELRCFM